jgi:hypothetical protein
MTRHDQVSKQVRHRYEEGRKGTSMAFGRNSWTPTNLKTVKPEGVSNSSKIRPLFPSPSSSNADTEVNQAKFKSSGNPGSYKGGKLAQNDRPVRCPFPAWLGLRLCESGILRGGWLAAGKRLTAADVRLGRAFRRRGMPLTLLPTFPHHRGHGLAEVQSAMGTQDQITSASEGAAAACVYVCSRAGRPALHREL